MLLYMFRAPLCPLSGAFRSIETTQQEHAIRTTTHSTGGYECSTKWKAPDDEQKGAQNM
jgi:hypothetical protein